MTGMFDANLEGLFNIGMGDSHKAFLYLFSPKGFSPQARRPLAYRFDTDLVNAAERAMVESVNKNSADVINRVTADPKVLSCVVPTATPTFVADYRSFESYWTFMLVTHNARGQVNHFSLETTAGDNCIIYYGFCTEEPINRIAANSYGAINPQAGLIITHKTMIQQTKSVVPGYGVQYRTDVAADLDVVHGRTLQSVSNQQVFMMRPEDLNGKVMAEPDGTVFSAVGDYASLGATANPITLNSSLTLPKSNLKTVIEAVSGAHATQRMNALGGSMGSALGSLGHDTITEMVSDNLQDVIGVRGIGLDENTMVTIADLMAMYHPQVEAFETPKASQYVAADQTMVSASSIFSSLLSTTIPPILVNCGIAQLSFSYDSYAKTIGGRGEEVHYFAPVIAMPEEEVKARVMTVFSYLERDVFPVLLHQRGHFSLIANCSVGGVSQLVVNFMDDTIRMTDPFEVPNLLGGLNNALVGDRTTMEHNSMQLNHLVSHLVRTPSQVSLSLQDELRLQQQINSVANSQSTKGPWI